MHLAHIKPLGDVLADKAEEFGDKTLFVDSHRSVSYRGFSQRATLLAGGLQGLGLQPGDRVVTYLPNCIELLEAYFGLARAGLVTVFANPQLTPREIRHILTDSGARAIITHTSLLDNVLAVRDDCPALAQVVLVGDARQGTVAFESVAAGPAPAHLPRLTPDDVTWIGYTSGTTGLPKGALLTHRNVMWVASTVAEIMGMGPDDRVLTALPLFHSYALNFCVLQVILCGATEWIQERFSPRAVLEGIQAHRITICPCVPAMLNLLLNFPERSQYDTSTLRLCPSAGSVLSAKLMQDFEAAFGAQIIDGYGMTETSSYVTVNRPGSARPFGSCGMGLPGSAVRIVDPQGRDVAPGERGELIVRGPHVTAHGYLNRPGEGARDGWWHSGDVATMDENGFIFIVDRVKDLIISGGYNIAPKEIEDVLYSHPAVMDVAVIGVPHEVRGEVPKAFVTLKPGAGATPEELLSYCQERLARYKLPASIEFRTEIPKTASGKVKRYELRAEGLGQRANGEGA